MSWNTIQQLIRIVGYAVGAYFFGEGVAEGELFQQAIGGLVGVAAFVWWMLKERSSATLRSIGPVLLVLALSACQPSTDQPPDARYEHYLACLAYTSALEKVAVWNDLGKFNEAQLAELRRIEAATTPLCMTETPTLAGADLIMQATASLEALLLTLVTGGIA